MKKRIYVEKSEKFNIEPLELQKKIYSWTKIKVSNIRIFNVYDIDNIDHKTLQIAINSVFSEPNVDYVYENIDLKNKKFIAIKNLAAQFDIRAESAIQCIKLLNPKSLAKVWTSKLYIFPNSITTSQIDTIKKILINKVEMEEKNLNVFGDKLTINKTKVKILNRFCDYKHNDLKKMSQALSLTYNDLLLIQDYFKNNEKRNPTETELKVIETYWSDHCRHSTFETKITKIDIEDQPLKENIKSSLNYFLKLREMYRKNKPITLMNIGTIMTKHLKKNGYYADVEESNEVNAHAVFANIIVDNKKEKWLIQFKNETHNHPTEIEPFGGAATCLGGAIRDPLSGRAYVYQGMRISGSANPIESVNLTLKNKLPQQKISRVSAEGFSSYGNQIGIATAFVKEITHPGYKAKHMEAGFVIGASKAKYVKRLEPKKGDIVVLIGGKTGRDGIGGASGSSKAHDSNSLSNSFAEVQKGNPIEERKIQRLFRNHKVTSIIKKANDFGAGGVSVAIGELSDSIEINLDAIPLKYQGLNGTEIAISESQERMAIVIDSKKLGLIKKYCKNENLEATVVAKITDNNRLIMKCNNEIIVNISREFLNVNGAKRETTVIIDKQKYGIKNVVGKTLQNKWINNMKHLNVASQKGIQQLFDFTIGGTTVLSPYGGHTQLSPSQVSAQKIPTSGYTNATTMVSYGFDPYLSESSPYLGGMYAVIESISKIIAAGGNLETLKLSFQEYYEKLGNEPKKWGKPLSSLLGTIEVMKEFNISAIGGKDSMSGTFNKLNVPPTLISFAFNIANAKNIISSDFKKNNNYIYLFTYDKHKNGVPNLMQIKKNFKYVQQNIKNKNIVSAYSIEYGGISAALSKMSFGNNIGFKINTKINLFEKKYGAIIVESTKKLKGILLGKTCNEWIVNNEKLDKHKIKISWLKTYDNLFPIYSKKTSKNTKLNSMKINNSKIEKLNNKKKIKKPKVLIPVFPGTNCEYDMEKRFKNAGAICKQLVFLNSSDKEIQNSITQLAKAIIKTNILVFSGGFSASDEPDGSGKFIVNILKNKKIQKAIVSFKQKGGLIIGICNGFQVLIKSGLLPYGSIKNIKKDDPTLFRNETNSHISRYIETKVSSTKGPWMNTFKLNQIHVIPISHGEGKFVISEKEYQRLLKNNQIAFQYSNSNNKVANNPIDNPNGSDYGIEGIISKDGMILGKMGHSERYEDNICKNIYGDKNQDIFRNAVNYFKGEQ